MKNLRSLVLESLYEAGRLNPITKEAKTYMASKQGGGSLEEGESDTIECMACDGTGKSYDETCVTCGGRGQVQQCPKCAGKGSVGGMKCKYCNRSGVVAIEDDYFLEEGEGGSEKYIVGALSQVRMKLPKTFAKYGHEVIEAVVTEAVEIGYDPQWGENASEVLGVEEDYGVPRKTALRIFKICEPYNKAWEATAG